MALPEAFVALTAGGTARAPLNPVTKLALLLPLLAALPIAPAWALGAVGAGCVAAGLALGIGRTMLRRLAILLLPVALALGVIHGMILPNGPAATLGPLTVRPDGATYAALLWSRLFALLAAGLLIVLTTPAQAIADALEDKGVPAPAAFLLTAPLAMAGTIAAEAAAMRDALQVRGVTLRGGPIRRLRALALIVMPLVRIQLVEAGPRARALEGRGFGALRRRTLLDPPADSRAQAALRWAMLALAVALIGAALVR